MSLIGKVASFVPKVYGYAKRGVKTVPYVIFGQGADAFVSGAKGVTKAANESWITAIKKALKSGGKSLEANIATVKAGGGGIFTQGLKAIKSIPRTLSVYAKKGAVEAGIKGGGTLAKLWGGTKGFFKGVGKKMPLIGNLMLIAFELPNIFKATKEQGIGQGVAEVAKAGVRLTSASLVGAAAGSAFGPIGSLVGFIAGDWIASKIVGKSYSEKKAEEQEALAQAVQSQPQVPLTTGQQVPFTGMTNPYQSMPISNPFANDSISNPYMNDIMMQNMNFNTIV